MHKPLFSIITGLIGIILGIFIGIFIIKKGGFGLAEKIAIELNPIEVLSLIVTAGLTIYVTRTLTKINEKEKEEKNLLINYFKAFNERLNIKIANILEKEEFNKGSTRQELKFLRKKLTSIINIGVKSKLIAEKLDETIALKERLGDIWEQLTYLPKKGETGKLLEEKKDDIEKSIIVIDELIFDIILKINSKECL